MDKKYINNILEIKNSGNGLNSWLELIPSENNFIFIIIYLIYIIIMIIILNSYFFQKEGQLKTVLAFQAPNDVFCALLRSILYFICVQSFMYLCESIIKIKDWVFLYKFDNFYDELYIGVQNINVSLFWQVVCFFVFIIFWVCFEITYRYFWNLNALKSQKLLKNYSDYIIILFFFLLGIVIIISSSNLLYIYLGLELVALSIVILTASKVYIVLSAEGGIKYLVLAAVSSGFYLLGSSFLYFSFGSLDLNDMLNNVRFNNFLVNLEPIIWIGSILLIISIFFKLGAAPFHNWVPDLYHSSSLPYVGIYSTLSKIVYMVFFIKLYYNLMFSSSIIFFETYYINVILIVSFLSLIIGSLGSLIQLKIKRFLAYSTITHVGYLLLPFLSTGAISYNMDIIPSILFYLFNYVLIMIQIITVLVIIFTITGKFIFFKYK